MAVDIRNHEGYKDPVPYEALYGIGREEKAASKPAFRPLVYICAPFRGDIEGNVKRAAAFAAFAYEKGNIPLTSHLLFPFLDDTNRDHRRDAMHMDLVLMGKCREVWVLGDTVTDGMTTEIIRAKKRRQPIRYFTSEYEEVERL